MPGVKDWFDEESSISADGKYRHRLLTERVQNRPVGVAYLIELAKRAHEDAIKYLRSPIWESLDPIGEPADDPAAGYPLVLEELTLYGYFGEIFAAFLAEEFKPFEVGGWRVPAFLFRFHTMAFQQLERYRQTGQRPGRMPGRSGDDCVAFLRDASGQIVASLICEAKCTPGHRSTLISKGHSQLSTSNEVPIDVLQLVRVLDSRADAESKTWARDLRRFWLDGPSAAYERLDLFSYLHGKKPASPSRKSWLSASVPHEGYKAARRLEAIETHLNDIKALVYEVYEQV